MPADPTTDAVVARVLAAVGALPARELFSVPAQGGRHVRVADLRALCDSVSRLQRERDEALLLRRAVNESGGECVDGCDSLTHAEGCGLTDWAAQIVRMQKEIESLRASREAGREAVAWAVMRPDMSGIDKLRLSKLEPEDCYGGVVPTQLPLVYAAPPAAPLPSVWWCESCHDKRACSVVNGEVVCPDKHIVATFEPDSSPSAPAREGEDDDEIDFVGAGKFARRVFVPDATMWPFGLANLARAYLALATDPVELTDAARGAGEPND